VIKVHPKSCDIANNLISTFSMPRALADHRGQRQGPTDQHGKSEIKPLIGHTSCRTFEPILLLFTAKLGFFIMARERNIEMKG